jgi:mRNA interferase HigB
MVVHNEQVVERYCRRHPDSGNWLHGWLAVSRVASWQTIQDVKRTYPAVDGGVRCSRGSVTVFDVCGNKYRLIVSINFKAQIVLIHEALTHAEYSKNLWKGRY